MARFYWPGGRNGTLVIGPAQPPTQTLAGGVPTPGHRDIIIQFRDGVLDTRDPLTEARVRATELYNDGRIREAGDTRFAVKPAGRRPPGPLIPVELKSVSAILDRMPALPISADPDLDGAFVAPSLLPEAWT